MAEQEQKTENTSVAKLNYLRIAPRKVRLVTNIIRGLPVQEAEAQLMLSPKKASHYLLKLIRSGSSNAENNKKMNPRELYIKEIKVDEAPTLKRWTPKAFGAIGEIHKKTSHVSVILGEKKETPEERFIISKPSDKEKEKKKEQKSQQKKPKSGPEIKPEQQAEKPKERKSPFRKMFRRKSI